MPSDNMKKILQQYQFNTDNMFANARIPSVNYSKNLPAMPTGSWVKSWSPNTASASTKAALTSINKNSWADAGKGILQGLGSALDIIDRPRNAIDSMIYAATDKKKDGIGGVLNAGWKGLSGQQHKYTSDILNNFGYTNKKGWNWNDPRDMLHDTVGFMGDVASDPITYLTFGAGGVVKGAVTKAAKPFIERALQEASQQGIKKGTHAFQQIMDKHLLSDAAQHAVNTAKVKASKSAINLDVPFGPKVSLASKPKFMMKQTQPVSTAAAQSLAKKMGDAGLTGAQRYDLMTHILGKPVTSTKDLNTQEFDFINKMFNDHSANSIGVHFNPKNFPDPFAGVAKPKPKAPKKEWENFVTTHYEKVTGNPLSSPASTMTVKDLKNLSKHLENHINQAHTANYTKAVENAMKNVKDDFTATGKVYHQYDGLTGVSPLTKKLFGKDTKLGKAESVIGKIQGSRRFVSTASKIGDHRIQEGLGHILNANNKAYAYSHQAIQKLKDIANTPEFKSLSPDDWKEVAYTIEGARPTHAGYVPPDPAKQATIDHVANLLVGDKNNVMSDYFMKHINKIESDAGLQRGHIADYFPHVYNLPQEQSFQDLQTQLLGMGTRGQKILAGLKNAKSGFQNQRKEFANMADLQDFLHANQGSAIVDQYKNVSWNPLEAFGKRAISGMNQVAKKESIDNIVGQGLHTGTNHVPEGWKVIESAPQGSPLNSLANQAVPPEIHNELTQVNKLLTSDKDLNGFLDNADKVMSVLRRNYTVTKVGFHVRQSIGNIFQNTLAGVTPSAYSKAAHYLTKPDKFPQWTKELLENGIIHTGSSAADLTHNLGADLQTGISAKNFGSAINPIGDKFLPARIGRKAGEFEDNTARVAHYMYMRGKGMSQQEASDSVRKYLYNYSEMNRVGQSIRLVVPFYQWMRNNLPFQLAQAARNPRTFNVVQSFLRAGQQDPMDNGKDWKQSLQDAGINQSIDQETARKIIEENGGVLPKYIQDNYIDIGGGNYYNIGLPSQDVKTMVTDPGQYFFGGLNPYFNLYRELTTNQNSLNNAPIDKSVPTGASIAGNYSGFRRTAETALGMPAQAAFGAIDAAQGNGWDAAKKSIGVNMQQPDMSKQIGILLQKKAKELNTRAKYLKDQQKQKDGGKS